LFTNDPACRSVLPVLPVSVGNCAKSAPRFRRSVRRLPQRDPVRGARRARL
jgi:hypothetical protein